MSGTRNFNLMLAAIASIMPSLAIADDIRLSNNAKLSGSVRSIHENGSVELISPLSPDPILLKGDAVERVIFSTPDVLPQMPDSRIELANGDVLPASIQSFDGDTLTVTSPDAGALKIPVKSVKSIQLGVLPQRQVYSGPNSLEEWTRDRQDSRNWGYDNGMLSAEGTGQLSMDLKCPEHFILRFSLTWQGQPNFQIAFADPLVETGKRIDRYYLQFNNSGLEIKREAAVGKRYTTIVQLNRTPDQFPRNNLDVEIRVDRKQSILHLYLNEEPEGRFIDPMPSPPRASGITLISNAPNGTSQQFSKFQILEWDLTGDRHRTEERGDPAFDALIIRRGDRYGGKLSSIRQSGSQFLYVFKSDFQDEALEIPDSEVSTVFFASETEKEETPSESKSFVLRLRTAGALQVSACTFTEDTVTAEHPLLGPLTLKRGGIAALEHPSVPPKAIPTP